MNQAKRKGLETVLRMVMVVVLIATGIPREPLAAADSGQTDVWDTLMSAPVGSRLRLVLKDGSEVRGRLVEASAVSVVMEDNETGSAGIRTPPGVSLRDRLTFLRADTTTVEVLSRPGGFPTVYKILIPVGIALAALFAFMDKACGQLLCLGQ